jgi:dihydroorotase
VADDLSVIGYVRERAGRAAVRIYPCGALTKGLEGKELGRTGRMQMGGAVAFSDDGRPVASGLLMRNALQYTKGIDALIILHEEDPSLAAGGMMHEGAVSSALGLRGIPAAAEEMMLARDLLLLKTEWRQVAPCPSFHGRLRGNGAPGKGCRAERDCRGNPPPPACLLTGL